MCTGSSRLTILRDGSGSCRRDSADLERPAFAPDPRVGTEKTVVQLCKKTSRAETLLPMTHADIRYLTLRHSTPTPRIYLCFARHGRGFAPRCALKSSLLSCPPKTWTARFSRRAALVTKSALCLDRVAVTLSDPATLVIEKW